MNIERVAGNLKDNAVPLLLGVGGVVVLYLLLSGKEESAELVPATGYMSYPDAVTNANVIIGEVNDHTSAEVAQLRDQQTEGTNAILDSLLSQNEFFSQGLETVLENSNANTGDIMGALQTESDLLQSSIGSVASSVNSTVSGLKSQISSQNSVIGSLTNQLNSQNSIISGLQNAVNNVASKVQNATKTPAKQATTNKGTTTTPATGSGTYTYTTKAGLNTNTSIVDALKATGADSSFSHRAQIAAANGISNYTGSYEQNVALLNKMKSGNLKKV